MNKRTLSFALILLFLASNVDAKKILFYEIGTPDTYKIDRGYSAMAERLRNKGYELASMSRGQLSKETLESYDMLVIVPSKSLTVDEISAILWFVTTRGKAVFIIGDQPVHANQLMIPFGMTMDDGNLIDSTNSIPGKSNQNFLVNRFVSSDTTRILQQGVKQVGFYGGHGLLVSGSAGPVVTGDGDTYSDTLSFASGSYPPIAASALFGRGLVFGLGDADMLSNDNVNSYDNMKFAENVVDWLSITIPEPEGNVTYEQIQVLIGELKLEKLRLETEVKTLQSQIELLKSENENLLSQLSSAQTELEEIKSGKIGPFDRQQWAIVLFGVCVIFAALIFSRKKSAKVAAPAAGGEDVLGELGYEFEEEPKDKKKGGSDEIDAAVLDKELGEL